ncbi:tetratricopeptide repeat protein [Maribacter litopenaei]|uniref:Tetratricopeptide repeat protein n=1 Tax=Maribacter litopenaei TaxID=2976127 RepID=A0ABY5YEI7_9FLAO|nr:tetratricopeptide repeat protein [Maribacter litopenaei]UWX56281.1 tetratricopeptide repeat protein [Maribacter litopenaei]
MKANTYQKNSILRDTILVLKLNEKAEELRYKKSDSIKMLAQEALDLSREINYEKGIIYSLYNLALHELYQGNTSKSIEYYDGITKNPNLKKYPGLAIKLYNDMAQAYFIRAEHPKAFELFLKAKNIADDTENINEIIRMNSNLGTLFLLLEDYEEALGYYHEAFQFIDENSPPHIRGLILGNLGYLKIRQNKVDEALDYLNEGIEYALKTDFSTIIAFIYLTLGDAYNLKRDYPTALEFYEKSNREYQRNGDKKGTADLLYGKAKAYIGLEEFKTSKKNVVESLDLYTSFNLKSGMEKCYRLLYELSKHESDLTSSLSYLEKAEAYSDTISKEKNKTDILMLKSKLAHEEEKRKLEEISTNTISKQKSYITWSSAFLLLSIVGIVMIYISNKKRKHLNQVLAEKTRVLSENEKVLNETNKTKDKLFSIVGHDLRGPIVSLKGLLKLSLDDDKGETQFRRFEL